MYNSFYMEFAKRQIYSDRNKITTCHRLGLGYEINYRKVSGLFFNHKKLKYQRNEN